MDRVLLKALAGLAALKAELDRSSTAPEWLIAQYHGFLDQLAAAGIDVDDFRIPPIPWTAELVRFSKPLHDSALVRTKLVALLNYVDMIPSAPPPGQPGRSRIGFHP